jgi:hypothetical protein
LHVFVILKRYERLRNPTWHNVILLETIIYLGRKYVIHSFVTTVISSSRTIAQAFIKNHLVRGQVVVSFTCNLPTLEAATGRIAFRGQRGLML